MAAGDDARFNIASRKFWASFWAPRTANPCGQGTYAYGTNIVDTLDFDTSAGEFAHLWWDAPPNWDRGTVTVKFAWTAASGSGNVAFKLAGRSFGDGDDLNGAMGTAVGVTDTLIAASKLHISAATAAITFAGSFAAGNPVLLEITRDTTIGSNLGVDAVLVYVEISWGVA